ncbi:MAG: ParB/RepB/Spo0J family partition protein [Lachnospiraceae bacterium]|nr:ParB/RepB/Spo0J family partition protein [Lachnospiraceae bacterium]
MAVKRGLGKGLDVLIPAGTLDNDKKTSDDKTQIKHVKITQVEPNPDQPRHYFDEDKLQEMTDSIKQMGVLEPLLVQDKGSHYMIVSGERRWRAAKKAGLKEIPVIIREFTDEQVAIISIIENIQRDDFTPIEEAQAYKKLIERYKLKQEEVADRVSKSRSYITNSMRLLKLDKRVQDLLVDESITQGHARALLAIEDNDKQFELAQDIMDKDLTVRDIEKEVRKLKNPAEKKTKKKIAMEVIYKDLEEKLKNVIGTKVVINPKDDNKGKIEIEYYSKDDLEKITDALLNAEK